MQTVKRELYYLLREYQRKKISAEEAIIIAT